MQERCYIDTEVNAVEVSLKDLRDRAGLTQKEAASYVGISRRNYIDYEKGVFRKDSIKYRYIEEKLSQLTFVDENTGMLSVKEITDICRPVFEEYQVECGILFGSYAKGNAKEDSDVDLLVLTDCTGLRFYGLVDRIKTGLRKRVDVLGIEQLADNEPLLKEILKTGVRIYG